MEEDTVVITPENSWVGPISISTDSTPTCYFCFNTSTSRTFYSRACYYLILYGNLQGKYFICMISFIFN